MGNDRHNPEKEGFRVKKLFNIILITILAILCLLALKLIVSYVLNENFISQYNKGNYDPDNLRGLFALNWPESYVAPYNRGNALYHNNDFDGAIDEYNRALSFNPPDNRECSIRINIALAMLGKITEDDDSMDTAARIENIDRSLELLHDAKEELFKHGDGCAHREDDNGHSETAEQLKADIEKMEKELQEKKRQLQEEEQRERERNETPEEQKAREQAEQEQRDKEEQERQAQEQQAREEQERQAAIESRLKEIQEGAREERQADLDALGGSSWYGGKTW